MVQELLLLGHVENVVGMAALRGALEGAFELLTPAAFANLIFGFFGALVYLMPLLGAWIAQAGWVPRAL